MRHAIVIGGSMGGLLAARVLSEYFERVTIVDRDRFPAVGELPYLLTLAPRGFFWFQLRAPE